jgi:hypothetical protein
VTGVVDSQSGGPRRRWPLVLAGVVTVAVLASVAGVVLTRMMRPSTPAESCLRPSAPSTANPAPAVQAPGGGGVEVVEQGFTQMVSPLPALSGEWVGIGAVLANTSDHVAYRTRLVLRVLDERGNSVLPEPYSPFANVEIPLIMPGQHIDVGSRLPVGEDAAGRSVRVARIEVNLGDTHWLPGAGNQGLAQVVTHHQHTERSPRSPTNSSTYYSVESPYCGKLFPRGLSIVFRDATGKVVGGDFDGTGGVLLRCDPGADESQTSTLDVLPPNFDGPKTTVSMYCDLQPKDRTIPTPSGAPVY